MAQYELWFKCCGNTVPLGLTPEIGEHGEYCQACDTNNPGTEILEA